MADFFTQSSSYHGTYQIGSVDVDPHFKICAVANINASNQLEATFWINENSERIDSDLGDAVYVIRDKNGVAVAGLTESGIAPDVNGYFHITPVSAALIYDLTHYVLEIDIPVDGIGRTGSIGLVNGE